MRRRSKMSHFRLAALLLGPLLLLGSAVGAHAPADPPGDDPSGNDPSGLPPYAEHPPLRHTGGFGEPTCHACHFGGDVNGGEGTLSVEGLPGSVRPGHSYRITVTLTAEMKRSGFMLSIRHPDGAQAGRLVPLDTARVAVATPDSSAVEYAHHTLAGTSLPKPNRASWTVRWTAPPAGDSAVLHVAVNAANDDASEFGDDVYAATAQAVVTQ